MNISIEHPQIDLKIDSKILSLYYVICKKGKRETLLLVYKLEKIWKSFEFTTTTDIYRDPILYLSIYT